MSTIMQDSKIGECVFLTPRVPQGLAAAVEGLTREVIRHRPDNIYIFAAHHFEKLLRLRDEYGINNNNNININHNAHENKKNMKILREMNEAIKERHVLEESKETSNFIEHSGWSLNETAKVLEKHRSIFGETGQKISTKEIRELAKNERISSSSKVQECSLKKKCEKHNIESKNVTEKYKTSSKKMESPRTNSQDQVDYNNYDSKSAPKIISQIPLTKDIKTELKKNRISSKERKKFEEKRIQVACEYSRETTIEKTSSKSIEKTKRSSYESRTEHRKSLRTEESIKKKVDKTKDKDEFTKDKRMSKLDDLETVKHYVAQNFSGITNLDELQTPSYVEKVQEVIDETSTLIKEKVEALKANVKQGEKKQQLSKEQRTISEEILRASNRSSRKSQDDSPHESSSSRSSKNGQSTKFSKGEAENLKSLEDNSNGLDQTESKNFDHSDAADSKISLPAVRPPSSKSTSRSLSARSDYDGLVLPPISPESTKSPKPKEDLVLPVLSSPHSTATSPDVPIELADDEDKVQRLEVNNEEVFIDSLNVTPEIPSAQRPDSLENSEVIDGSDSSGHVSPLETLKDKLLEIEEVQKRIENVLDDTVTNVIASKDGEDVKSDHKEKLEIQNKLLEIQESEKRIEQILDSQTSSTSQSETMSSEIKNKLQQLEEVERRINDIFVGDTGEEHSKKATSENDTDKQKDDKNVPVDKPNEKTEKDIVREISKDEDVGISLNTSADGKSEKKVIVEHSEDDWVYSPHSYILTEGSPYEIPDTVTTVIIPDRIPSPDDTLQVQIEDGEVYSTFLVSDETITRTKEKEKEKSIEEKNTNIHDAFGEAINVDNMVETSTVDTNYIRGIKASHDMIMSRLDLSLIKEERDREVEEAEIIDSEDEKVLKVVTTSLEEILENEKVEYVSKEEVKTTENIQKDNSNVTSLKETLQGAEYESTDETKETSISDGQIDTTDIVENSMDNEDITARSAESTNEIKETSITTERSSLSFDPNVPIVPELNLDSLPDLTISSFNLTDDEQKDGSQKESKDSSLLETPMSSDSKKNVQLPEESQSTKSGNIEKKDSNEIIHEDSEKDTKIPDNVLEENLIKESKLKSSELLEKSSEHNAEQSKELNKSIDSVKSDVLDKTKTEDEKIVTSSRSLEETVKVHVDEIKDDHSEILATNIDESVARDDINKSTSEETKEKQQTSPNGLETKSNLLETHTPDKHDDAISSLKKSEDILQEHKQPCLLDVVDKDQSGQLVDSSRVSSQCTESLLDSDDLSIKTKVEDTISTAVQNNQAQDIKTMQEKVKTMSHDKSSDAESLSANVALTFAKKESEINQTDESHVELGITNISKDLTSSTEISTLKSAATVIQAGVRGFLLRRRLKSSQNRSSTLDSVPSIQESFVAEGTAEAISKIISSSTPLEPIVEAVPSPASDSKVRKKLVREDAVQKKTMSLESAFAENRLQHTGEFHDCIPLPVFDARTLALKRVSTVSAPDPNEFNKRLQDNQKKRAPSLQEEGLLGQILLSPGPLVDVVIIPEPVDPMLQNRYLNFITSVEDVASDFFAKQNPESPKGVIIEDVTSLDENKTPSASNSPYDDDKKSYERPSTADSPRPTTAVEKLKNSETKENLPVPFPGKEDSLSLASVGTISDEPVSMNIEEVLDLGEEDNGGKKLVQDLAKTKTLSLESHDDATATRSPVTVMQTAGSFKGASTETDVDFSTEEDPNTAVESHKKS